MDFQKFKKNPEREMALKGHFHSCFRSFGRSASAATTLFCLQQQTPDNKRWVHGLGSGFLLAVLVATAHWAFKHHGLIAAGTLPLA